jgi:hypothetical protein
VDLSAIEIFSAPAGKYFSVARNAQYKIPDLKREYRYFINKYRFKVGFLAHPDLAQRMGA